MDERHTILCHFHSIYIISGRRLGGNDRYSGTPFTVGKKAQASRFKKIMLNSADHEILNAHNYKNKCKEILHILVSEKPKMLFFLLINVQMPTINCWHLNIYQQGKFHAQLS